MNRSADIRAVFHLLLAAYGPRSWWPAETPLEVCVGAILTQNTAWGNVEKAIANLKGAGALSAEALGEIPEARLAELIRPSGFFNVKSRRLKAFVRFLFATSDGSLDDLFRRPWRDLREELLGVAGIGPETADSILLYAGGQPTFVVDAYTRRLFGRLGICRHDTEYEELRGMFMTDLAPDVTLYNEYHALIVQHGKERCRTRPLCDGCPLLVRCRHGWGVTGRAGDPPYGEVCP